VANRTDKVLSLRHSETYSLSEKYSNMDGFDEGYKGHMIFSHAAGPDSGPWVGMYSVFAMTKQSELYSVLHGTATGAFPSIKFATSVAWEQAKLRIDALLEERARRAASADLKVFERHISDFRDA
jgi:hypothetical protein